MINFYYPRWLWPNNLGDSVMTTFIPKILKTIKNDELTVITDAEFGEVFKRDKNVDVVREPYRNEILNHGIWKNIAFNRIERAVYPDGHPLAFIKSCLTVYPEWFPSLWDKWNSNFNHFYNHPSINIITLNYCLQLGLPLGLPYENYYPEVFCDDTPKQNAVAIVPDTKLAGRPSPHPGCDGIGYRLAGLKGFEYWKEIVSSIKKYDSTIKIYEFSRENNNLGDYHISKLPILELAKLVKSMRLGIMSDGGMHHIFNSQRTKVYLLGAQKINKPYFFKLSNGIYDEECYSKCLNRCKPTITNLSGWPSLDSVCNTDCESPNLELIISGILKSLK